MISMNKKVLITDKVHPVLINGLDKCGFQVIYQPQMSYQDVQERVAQFNGIIINSKIKCDRTFLEQAQHLDFIGRLGSGLDIIDQEYARKLGVTIISSPEGNANAVAEHTLGMLLGLTHKIVKSHSDVRNLQWTREPNRGTELYDKVIGIIGFGHTGPSFARKLKGFGVRILVYDKYKQNIAEEFEDVEVVPLAALIVQSDVVSIHLPLTNETENFVNRTFLSKMKKDAIIINTSRGRILDSRALIESLKSGSLYGACLDVLENEKPETWTLEEMYIYQYLLEHPNVIITPHIAGWTTRSLELIASVLLNKIQILYK